MAKKYLLIISVLIALVLYSCNKKSHPAKTTTETVKKKTDTVSSNKVTVKRKTRTPIPKVIVVNDSAAHKSVDGRLYYDMLGHRYWRNYQDGKYYLFNKSMYYDDAFKAPK